MTRDGGVLLDGGIASGTIPALIFENASLCPLKPAVSWLEKGTIQTLSWAEYRSRIVAAALGYVELGVGPGRDVAIPLGNRVEHIVADLAAAHCGAASVSIYQTLSDEQIAHMLMNSAPAVVIVEDDAAARRVAGLKWGKSYEAQIVAVHSTGESHEWSHLESAGERSHIANTRELNSRLATLKPDAPLTYIYTSGTTGPTKGVLLTTENILTEVESMIGSGIVDFDYRAISYLPLAHIVDRLLSIYTPARLGGHVVCCPNLSGLLPLLVQFQPTHFFGEPRIFEKLRKRVESMLDSPSLVGVKPKVDEERRVLAEASGLHRGDQLVPADLTSAAVRARAGAVRDIRARIGMDKASTVGCAGVAMTEDLHEFWASLGIEVLLSYGLTENAGPVISDRTGSGAAGSVGLPMPGWEVRITEEGEILVRGPGNTVGYRNRPDATADLYTEDGWMRTGDIGRIDEAGRLHITGRKNDLLISSAGRNISPASIELRLTGRSIIDQVMIFAEAKPYVTALITLDPTTLVSFAVAKDISWYDPSTLQEHPVVHAETDRLVAEANALLSRPEQIKKYAILSSTWTPQSGELTPTMKLRRAVIQERFAEIVDSLYDSHAETH